MTQLAGALSTPSDRPGNFIHRPHSYDCAVELSLQSHVGTPRGFGRDAIGSGTAQIAGDSEQVELSKLIAFAGHIKRQTPLPLSYGTGLRACDVVSLKVGDIEQAHYAARGAR